jgi:hypothetical protein
MEDDGNRWKEMGIDGNRWEEMGRDGERWGEMGVERGGKRRKEIVPFVQLRWGELGQIGFGKFH